MSAEAALIWCPFPDAGSARQAVEALLDERLVACGNVVPGMSSHFAWQSGRIAEVECGVLFKTTAVRLGAAMERLQTLHPYDTPAITGWPVFATAATREWLERETAGTD
ncbi:MAG TPA: divalent-cation tolerance protein CutA [Qipengyuania sp.]|nr:divalent-cation tolerance protein CutA [Qipengyuania sp.]